MPCWIFRGFWLLLLQTFSSSSWLLKAFYKSLTLMELPHSHFRSLPPLSQIPFKFKFCPTHAAISVIHILCHLQNATPRPTVGTAPQFCLSDQFCAFSPVVPCNYRLSPCSWELFWGLGKPLLWQWGPLVVAAAPWNQPGSWQSIRAPCLRGKSLGSAGTVWINPAWGKPCCLPRGHHHLGEDFFAGIREQRMCRH